MSYASKLPYTRRTYYQSLVDLPPIDDSVYPSSDHHQLVTPITDHNEDDTNPNLSQVDITLSECHDVSIDNNCNPTGSRDQGDVRDTVDVAPTRISKKFPSIITPKTSKNSHKQREKNQGDTNYSSKSKLKTQLLAKPKRHSRTVRRLAPVRPLYASDQVDYVRSTDYFSCLDICIYLFSICSYLADVGTDIWVAYMYFHQGHTIWFTLTLVFVLVPGITMTLFSLVWYMQDHKYHKNNAKCESSNSNITEVSKARWASRTICLLLQIGPVIRYIECLLYGLRSKKERDWYVMLAFEDTDSTMLRLLECFMEAAPQLVLQLYIMMTLGLQDGWLLVAGQITSCFTSLASVSWALAAYHRSLRYSLQDKANMTYPGIALQFFWRFFTIGSRVIALAMFASTYKYWAFVAIGSHWIVMFIWILAQRTKFCHTRCQEMFFDMVIGVVYIFCYLNLLEDHTRLRYIFYYIITYLENIGLMVAWYAIAGTSSSWYITPAMVAVFAGLFVGIIFMLAYYKFLHPNNLSPEFSDKRIKICVPWKELYLCQLPPEGSHTAGHGPASQERRKSVEVKYQTQV